MRPMSKALTKPKVQVKLRLYADFVAELQSASEEFGFDSLPAMIEELLRLQYPVWKAQPLASIPARSLASALRASRFEPRQLS